MKVFSSSWFRYFFSIIVLYTSGPIIRTSKINGFLQDNYQTSNHVTTKLFFHENLDLCLPMLPMLISWSKTIATFDSNVRNVNYQKCIRTFSRKKSTSTISPSTSSRTIKPPDSSSFLTSNLTQKTQFRS